MNFVAKSKYLCDTAGMADNSKELSDELYKMAVAARKRGMTWHALLKELLYEILNDPIEERQSWQKGQEQSFVRVWDNDEDACYDCL